MTTIGGPNIPQEGLRVSLDITNQKCYQANNITDPIIDDTRLYNLADRTFIDYFYNNINTEAYQETITPSNPPFIVMQHNAFEGNTNRDTNWQGMGPGGSTTIDRVLNFSFISWYKFDNVNQQVENIYGGGFNGRLSFYLSSGGTSANSAILFYSNAGGTNAFQASMGSSINDGNWHMRSYSVTAALVTGTTYCSTYVDGEYYGIYNSNTKYENPTTGVMTWGSWSGTYGNMSGQLNDYMYYERAISANEHKQIYNVTKNKYQ